MEGRCAFVGARRSPSQVTHVRLLHGGVSLHEHRFIFNQKFLLSFLVYRRRALPYYYSIFLFFGTPRVLFSKMIILIASCLLLPLTFSSTKDKLDFDSITHATERNAMYTFSAVRSGSNEMEKEMNAAVMRATQSQASNGNKDAGGSRSKLEEIFDHITSGNTAQVGDAVGRALFRANVCPCRYKKYQGRLCCLGACPKSKEWTDSKHICELGAMKRGGYSHPTCKWLDYSCLSKSPSSRSKPPSSGDGDHQSQNMAVYSRIMSDKKSPKVNEAGNTSPQASSSAALQTSRQSFDLFTAQNKLRPFRRKFNANFRRSAACRNFLEKGCVASHTSDSCVVNCDHEKWNSNGIHEKFIEAGCGQLDAREFCEMAATPRAPIDDFSLRHEQQQSSKACGSLLVNACGKNHKDLFLRGGKVRGFADAYTQCGVCAGRHWHELQLQCKFQQVDQFCKAQF
jgi:hypothetical protein